MKYWVIIFGLHNIKYSSDFIKNMQRCKNNKLKIRLDIIIMSIEKKNDKSKSILYFFDNS